MIIHPDLRALRSDDTPQRAAQAALRRAMDGWGEGDPVARVRRDLDSFAAYRGIEDCPALAALFEPASAAAQTLVAEFVATAAAALREAPLGHVPVRNFTDGLLSTLLLARSGNAALWLVAIDGEALGRKPRPVTADFSPNEMWEHVLAGHGRAERIAARADGGGDTVLERRMIELRPGDVICRDAGQTALQFGEVAGCLVLLRLQRRRSGAGPTREYRLADGKLVHQAAGNPRDSRIELMMALLGRMGRGDAVPQLAAIARGGAATLRWQALRECLALDTLTGFRTLSEIAGSPGDALAGPAGALRRQLVAAHPQLLEIDPCPG